MTIAMRKARKAYGVSQSYMSYICGFGTNQWRIYENGKRPTRTNELLIKIAITPRGMLNLLTILPQFKKDRHSTIYKEMLIKVQNIVKELEKASEYLNDTYFWTSSNREPSE